MKKEVALVFGMDKTLPVIDYDELYQVFMERVYHTVLSEEMRQTIEARDGEDKTRTTVFECWIKSQGGRIRRGVFDYCDECGTWKVDGECMVCKLSNTIGGE